MFFKKDIKKYIFVLILFVLISFFLIPFIYYQSVYLSLKIDEKQIEKIEYVIYENEPFHSIIKEKYFINSSEYNTKPFLEELKKQEIVLYNHPKITKKVLFIYFDDGSSVNAFVDNNKIGLDFSKVWVKNNMLSNLIINMKEENLINIIK